MDREAWELVEVRCYARDKDGYYSQLSESNFTIDLTKRHTPLVDYIAANVQPDLGLDSSRYDFKCYGGDFKGEPIDLSLQPTEVEYLARSIREQKKAILILCKEPNSCPVLPDRNRLALITKRPSMIAKDFMRPTRHSVLSSRSSSSSDASYIDCAFASPPPEPIEEDDTSSESHDDISVHTRPHPPLKQARTLQIIPTLPLTKQKRRSDTHKSKDLSASMSALNAMLSPPKSAATKGNQLIKQRSDTTEIFRQSKTLGRKTPHQHLRKFKGSSQLGQTGQTMPLTRRRAHHQPPLDARYSMSDIIIPAPMTPSDSIHITSPIPPQSQPPVISEQAEASKLKRQSAFKRKSLLHLGLECLTYDLSEEPLHVENHTNEVAQGTGMDAEVTMNNYSTVKELKETLCAQLKQGTSKSTLEPSDLVLFYSHEGNEYELLFEHQFLVSTFFHKLLSQYKNPQLKVRLAQGLLDKELRVLYRISQLTGVLLEESVVSQGLNVGHLTSIPPIDQHEVQAARRSLHGFMTAVVTERNEEEYTLCRDLASREASMSLSLMTPADNKIKITFHYKTVFSLTRRLSIHTYASRALEDLFPCLVACGLVKGRLEDHTLQVSGEESYIHGDCEIIAFRHIRKCIVKAEPVNLSVTEKPPVEVDRPHTFSWLALDLCSDSSMCHSELSSHTPINRENVGSVWETREQLRITKLQIRSFPHTLSSSSGVHMKLSLYHGSTELCEPVVSTTKLRGSEINWMEMFQFNIEIRNIPKAAKIMFTFMEGSVQRMFSHGGRPKFLFWGMMSVFDHSGRLRSGDYELRLWQGMEMKDSQDEVVPPNPTIFASNNPCSKAVKLKVKFQETSVPIFYPSTNCQSCTVMIKQHPATANVNLRRDYKRMLALIRKDRLYKNVPHYIQAIQWNNLSKMIEIFLFLSQLEDSMADIPVEVSLRLLDSDFPDEHVRAFAVRTLEDLPDEQLEDFLLQLVQALKFEAHHDSALARFLLKRALNNKTIGHFFFWYLKSEMHNRLHTARFSVILEAYLKGCGEGCLTRFTDQVDIENVLCNMGMKLHKECAHGRDLEKMQSLLPSRLSELEAPRFIFIPVYNPRYHLGNLNPTKCKVMSSAKRPMWLELYNIHPNALTQSPTRLILKLGDDLRQDMITLRMFSLFEKLWEEQGLDLELIPYGCMATGPMIGVIEVVKNARTIAEVSSVRDSTKLFEWIKSHQKNEFGETDQDKLDAAVKRFTRSCAGYSVATYVLGIGDRHNDNIMVTTSGNLFHIDFGHFLGNIKYFLGFKREWAPFVLTPDFVYVLGGEHSEMFETYKNLCCRAFLTLRRHADLIINLFSLMRSTGIPELTCVEDTDYIRNVLVTDKSEHAAEEIFRDVIQKCLDLKWTVQIMWKIHILRHGS